MKKVCLIDTVERKFIDEYFARIDDILLGRQVDYLVVNHVEPDHSGSIKALKINFGIEKLGIKDISNA